MDDSVLTRARKEHLVRPDVSRAEVSRFLRRLSEEQQELRPAQERLAEEREVLKRRIQTLAEAQREAKRRLLEVEAELDGRTIEGRVMRDAGE
jgi:DNA-binding transcriptional MerR regulator